MSTLRPASQSTVALNATEQQQQQQPSTLTKSRSATRLVSQPIHLRSTVSTIDLSTSTKNLTTASSTPSKRQSKPAKPGLRPHALRTAAWLCVAAIVALAIFLTKGKQRTLEFVTGYIVEYSLSVDNLFVFLLIFKYFQVPKDAQESVLFWGILGAMVLRGFMIVCGKALVQRFEWVAIGFAFLLIYSAGKLLFEDDDEEEDLEGNRVIRFSKYILPVSDRYVGDRFFVMEGGELLATPLMVVLVAIELSDVVFALDSVPAVLGISSDTFVIYVSNILAIMGLRSLFFVLATSIGNVRFLKQALSIVLVFIGVKMIAGCFGYEFGIAFSLFVVALTLAGGVGLSFALPSPTHSRSSSLPDIGLPVVNSV